MIRILIADDQELVRSGLSALINLEIDIQVIAQAANGKVALELCKQHTIDVCLIDIQMPELDGIAATKEITSAAPQTKVIIVTTFGRTGYLRQALEAGAKGFILKDAPVRQLTDAIRKVHLGLVVIDQQLAATSLTEGDNPMTARESQVLKFCLHGASIKIIARELSLSQGTVRNHLSHAMAKTHAQNRFQAAQIAEQRGWI